MVSRGIPEGRDRSRSSRRSWLPIPKSPRTCRGSRQRAHAGNENPQRPSDRRATPGSRRRPRRARHTRQHHRQHQRPRRQVRIGASHPGRCRCQRIFPGCRGGHRQDAMSRFATPARGRSQLSGRPRSRQGHVRRSSLQCRRADAVFASTKPRPRTLRQEFARRFQPQQALLVVVGPFEGTDAESALRKAFASWKPSPARRRAGDSQTGDEVPLTPFILVPRAGSVQTTLRLAYPGPLRHDSDYEAAEVANAIYGGMFGSRLVAQHPRRQGLHL